MISKPIGKLFAQISIKGAAVSAIHASRSWGGEMTITVSDSGECTAWAPNTPALESHLRFNAHEPVGTYDAPQHSRANARNELIERIAGDILVRAEEISGMRAAA